MDMWAWGILRALAINIEKVSSAVEMVLPLGVFMTTMPRLVAASTSTLSTPTPARPMVPLSGRGGEARPFRLLGQYKGTLILLEGPDGLYLVDQHVAHERILYERMKMQLDKGGIPAQALLVPETIALHEDEADARRAGVHVCSYPECCT